MRASFIKFRRFSPLWFFHSISKPRLQNFESRDFIIPNFRVNRIYSPVSNVEFFTDLFIFEFGRIFCDVDDDSCRTLWYFVVTILVFVSEPLCVSMKPDEFLTKIRSSFKKLCVFCNGNACAWSFEFVPEHFCVGLSAEKSVNISKKVFRNNVGFILFG